MPMGLRGLIVAGLLAAIMSTIVSVLNSLATVTLKDIYQRVLVPNREEGHYLLVPWRRPVRSTRTATAGATP